MKYQALSLAFSALALSVAAPAMAQTVDFNELHTPTTGLVGSPLTSGGYSFDATPGHRFLIWGSGDSVAGSGNFDPDLAGSTVGLQDGGAVVSVSKVGGGPFDLISIQLDDIYNGAFDFMGNYGGTVSFTFNYAAGGSSTQNVTVDGLAGMETFDFNQIALSSFSMTSVSTAFGLFQFDNMVTRASQQVAPQGVPEPASWAMMLVGFGGIGAVIRRRRLAVAFA